MHRSTFTPRMIMWGLLLAVGLLAPGIVTKAVAQPGIIPAPAGNQQPEAPVSVLLVPINTTKQVQMSTKARIAQVRNENPKVARVQTLLEDPTAILISGLSAGQTRVTLTDENKRTEFLDVQVPDESETQAELVRQRLLKVLNRVAPAGNIDVVIGPNNSLVITGTVQDNQKADLLISTARSFLGAAGANVVNGLTIGGVQQVQLEVVVAVVNRTEARNPSWRAVRHSRSSGSCRCWRACMPI